MFLLGSLLFSLNSRSQVDGTITLLNLYPFWQLIENLVKVKSCGEQNDEAANLCGA